MFDTMKDFPLGLGCHSEGTLRSQDLLATGADILDTLARHLKRCNDHDAWSNLEAFTLGELLGAARECCDAMASDDSDENEERASELFNEICDFLTDIAPPFVYFGAQEGDGACFGFWADVDGARDYVDGCGGDKPDAGEAARAGIGAYLHVNDHGNTALYFLDGVRGAPDDKPVWVEVWAVV